MRAMKKPISASSRWLVGIAIAVLALVVLSVVIALVSRAREAAPLSEDTPEGVVQAYLLAIERDDGAASYNYLGSTLRQYCSYSGFRETTTPMESRDMRVTLDGTERVDGEVEVNVHVSHVSLGPPLGGGESVYQVRFYLQQEGALWRFSQPPWPMDWCPDWEKAQVPDKASER